MKVDELARVEMERMIQGVDDRLRRRLDLLDRRGRDILSTASRRRAMRQALGWASAASAVGPLLFALSAFFVAPTPLGALLAWGAAPLAAATTGYHVARRRSVATGPAGLALLDHRLRLNDRLQTSDEFERLRDRSAFHEAALHEAAPWVDRAQSGDVGEEAASLRLGRSSLWFYPVLGALCLVIAFVIPRLSGVGGASGRSSASELVQGSSSPVDAVPQAIQASATGRPAASAGIRGGAEGALQGRDEPGGGLVSVFQSVMARLSPSSDASQSPQGAAERAARPSGSAGIGSESAGQGGQGAAGGGASRSGAAHNSDGTPVKTDAPSATGEPTAQDDSDASVSEATAGQFSGARQNAPSAPRPQAQNPGSGSPQGGEGQQPGRSRRGDRGQPGRDQGGGQGENGQVRGDDDAGVKKGRGVSTLMLSTPMQDRLPGMASPGRIRTTTREGVPQPLPSASATAQARGTALGDAARTAPLTANAQEQRLARDYFIARNGQGR